MQALTKLNAQYFSAIFKEVSPQPNSPDLNPVDHHIWSVLEQHVYRTHIRDVNHLMTRLVEDWQMFYHRINVHRLCHQAIASTSAVMRSRTRWTL